MELDEILKVENQELSSGTVEIWTLNRPEKLNALNSKVLGRLDTEGTRLESILKEDLAARRALILRGAGEKSFVAGADISEMQNFTAEEARDFSRLGHRVFGRLEKLPIPTLVMLQGFTLGGGLELAMCCDILISSPTAEFGQPESNLGIIPGFGGTARLASRIGMGKALELLFSGQRIKALEAQNLGLINRIVSDTDLFQATLKVADEVTKRSSPLAIAMIKRLARAAEMRHFELACQAEAEAFGEIFKSEDKREGVSAFLEKRKGSFRGK
jgi:enoyl-CoA hydratase